jgi:hypothetical protein
MLDSYRTAGRVLDFFTWSHGHGANSATQLGYVTIPAALSKQVRA